MYAKILPGDQYSSAILKVLKAQMTDLSRLLSRAALRRERALFSCGIQIFPHSLTRVVFFHDDEVFGVWAVGQRLTAEPADCDLHTGANVTVPERIT
jgi:hypothetical protein